MHTIYLIFQIYSLLYQLYTLFLQSSKKGSVAEWLGKALQKLLQRFEPARGLKKKKDVD